jgi:signal transduction histidine kinase
MNAMAARGGQFGAMTTIRSDEIAPGRERSVPRFADELIRPFAVVAISAITVLQLLTEHPPAELPWLTWALAAIAIGTGVPASLPWPRVPDRVEVVLVAVFAVAGALLFGLSPATAAVVFVYFSSAIAGEALASRRTAFTVAAVATVVTAAATWVTTSVLHMAGESPWWLTLTVGLPLYVGIARRARNDALAVAEFAARESMRAAASEAREAALEERGRIAREIHDLLGHALSGIAMQLDMADALHTDGRDAEANEAVRTARALAVTGIGETRRAIHALREDTLPLPETMARLAESSAAACVVDGEPGDVRVEVAQAVIRTAQEAITNAHRHAPGAGVTLLLEYRPESIRLTVTDTGSARPQGHDPGSGMGLVGMRERAGLLGGTLYAGPVDPPSHGWLVRLELPR